MRLHGLHLCLAVAGFAAGSTLASTTTNSFVFITGGSRVGLLFSGGAVGVTVGASVAAVVAWGARVRIHRILAAMAGLALMAIAAAPWGGEYGVYAAASGAGVLLGALAAAVPSLDALHGPNALAAGVLAGIVCAEPLVRLGRDSSPRRYADYLPTSSEPVDVLLLVLVGAAAIAVVVLLLADTRAAAPGDVRVRGKTVLVGIVLPAAWLILHWRFVGSVTGLHGGTVLPGWWFAGLVLVPVTIAIAAWIPGPTAAVLLAGTAVAVVGPSELAWYTDQWWALLIPVALVVLGSVMGNRISRPWIGIGGLVIVVTTELVENPPWDIAHLVAVLVIFPVASAFLIASCLPSEPAITTTALIAPAAILVPLSAKYGWTAYTPLQGEGSEVPNGSAVLISAGVTGISLMALGAGIGWVRRRTEDHRNRPEIDGTADG
ncbi:hypothetical protein [Rhodococcus phenolicus]|uniref:hypothetical protein n=1 Tax=Rhodococcus phenolicus TaxID=263849 RepID=UPI0008310421|nr:hypothetical protein [Rhodococcus phenolicus]